MISSILDNIILSSTFDIIGSNEIGQYDTANSTFFLCCIYSIGQGKVGRDVFNSKYSIKFDYIISILIAFEESSLIILSLIKSKRRCF